MSLFAKTWRLRDAYRNCFRLGRWKREDGSPSPDALQVLNRLRVFCRADKSTFDQDPRVHALLEGRREVWIEVLNVLDLTDDQILKLKDEDE